MRSDEDVMVLRTGKLVEADYLASIFEQEEVPFYRRQETITGIGYTTPLVPTGGPGVFFTLWVPPEVETQARQIMSDLQIVSDPTAANWDVGGDAKSRQAVAWWVWAMVLFFALWGLRNCSDSVRHLLSR